MGKKSSKLFVGMDVHKESIDISLAEVDGEVRHYGGIGGDSAALMKAVRKLESLGKTLVFIYEAGPCGYTIYRNLVQRAHECWVVAPSETPRRGRDRIKTDRRDSLKLAGLARAGELTPIYVPDADDEAMRDLVRAREDMVVMQRQVRQRLGALLLRNDIRYAGKTAWTEAHRRWIARLEVPGGPRRIAFEEYVGAVKDTTERVQRMTKSIEQQLPAWRWQPMVGALQAFRGIQQLHAARIVAELGDLNRFAHPRELMAYLGMIPTENSSGPRHRQGAITKAGNSSARKALVEAAWAYQRHAAVSPIIARRQAGLPKAAIDIAWKAQLRLCARFKRLHARGVQKNKVVVAIARELAGFVWAVGQHVKPT
jgi:transposase